MWKVSAVMSSEAVWILLSFSLLSCSSLYGTIFFPPFSPPCPLSSVFSIPHHPLYVSESPPHLPLPLCCGIAPIVATTSLLFLLLLRVREAPLEPRSSPRSSYSPIWNPLPSSPNHLFMILPLLHPHRLWIFRNTVILTRELWFEWHLPFSLCCFSPFSIHYYF